MLSKAVGLLSPRNSYHEFAANSMRMAGPREAVWHAIIRKNYGVPISLWGGDHAGPGKNSLGIDFYPPYAAQELALKYASDIGIEVVPFMEMVYVQEDLNYQPVDKVDAKKTIMTISGTQLRKALRDGEEIPEWFSFPEVLEELRKVYPPRTKQGFTLFFTGLSGAGKSTLANALAVKLMELQIDMLPYWMGVLSENSSQVNWNFPKSIALSMCAV